MGNSCVQDGTHELVVELRHGTSGKWDIPFDAFRALLVGKQDKQHIEKQLQWPDPDWCNLT